MAKVPFPTVVNEAAMRRFSLKACWLGILCMGSVSGSAAEEIVPQRPVLPQCRVLESLIGTWNGQVSGGTSEIFDKPTSIGRVTRQWLAGHRFVNEQGPDHEAFITFDSQQNIYRAWYFHRNGHVWEFSGRWTGNTDRLSLYAEMDENQSMSRSFQVFGDKSHECDITWTDDSGHTGVYGIFNFTRCQPQQTEKENTVAKPAMVMDGELPPELKVFANDIGKWTFDGSSTTGEETTKISGTRTVRWILGGHFIKATVIQKGRDGEGITVAGFDVATKAFRSWTFDPQNSTGEPAIGSWDEKERSMTWKAQFPGEFSMVCKKQWVNSDTAKSHFVVTRSNGAVSSTQDGTQIRQKAN
jgi:hypothetical protein